ncbi:MAG: hypothetical protein Q8867_07255 [Bacteroidota bacterium]|nr:hypothetical protein [Bacteroidota bacterium]
MKYQNPAQRKLKEAAFFLLIFFLSLGLYLKIHINQGYLNWESEIYGDKAGYYVYLPSVFFYHFNPNLFPAGIDEKTGFGFQLDTINHKVNTKYPYGVSLMVSPFFGISCLISTVSGLSLMGGFAPLFHRMMGFSAIIYLVFGLWFLKKMLERKFSSRTACITTLLIYFATNLIYYTVSEPLMSHVYSFFLFSLFLFSLDRFLKDENNYGAFFLICLSFVLAIIVRPVNCILFLLYFFWDIRSGKEILQRVKNLFRPRYFLTFILIFTLFILPQLFYWKYLTGNYFHYSYAGESFSDWNHPRILEVWFSTLNGLFLYTPVLLIFLAGLILMLMKRKRNSLLILFVFLLMTYMAGSWHQWYFGCSYGQRTFIEYYVIFSFPAGFFLEWTITRWKFIFRGVLALVLSIFTVFNIQMMYYYEKCFWGSTWDWNHFEWQLKKAKIIPWFEKDQNFSNDYENRILTLSMPVEDTLSHSGSHALYLRADLFPYCVYEKPAKDLIGKGYRQVEASFHVLKYYNRPLDGVASCSIYLGKTLVFEQNAHFGKDIYTHGEWMEKTFLFDLPPKMNSFAVLRLHIQNNGSSDLFIDDLKVRFE